MTISPFEPTTFIISHGSKNAQKDVAITYKNNNSFENNDHAVVATIPIIKTPMLQKIVLKQRICRNENYNYGKGIKMTYVTTTAYNMLRFILSLMSL